MAPERLVGALAREGAEFARRAGVACAVDAAHREPGEDAQQCAERAEPPAEHARNPPARHQDSEQQHRRDPPARRRPTCRSSKLTTLAKPA